MFKKSVPLHVTHIDQGCNEARLLGDKDYLKTPGCWPKVSFSDGLTYSYRVRPRGDKKYCYTDNYGEFWDSELDALIEERLRSDRPYNPSTYKQPIYEAFTA